MARAPLIGRLYWYPGCRSSSRAKPVDLPLRREYLALYASLVLVFLEGFIRIITLGLRK